MKRNILTLLIFLIFVFSSCERDLESLGVVYVNDFETGDTENLINAQFDFVGNNMVCGPYNNESLLLNIADLPKHDYLIISFDLFIHDSWDGLSGGVDGPDIWGLELNNWIDKNENARTSIFKTTFSNSVCNSAICLLQSYPDEFPISNFPKTASSERLLPGRCILINEPNGTSKYNVIKTFQHKSDAASIRFYDELIQSNTSLPKCDESWSIDNIIIQVAEY